MSTTYIKEPPTSGKVRLKTTVGDIDIELWTKEAPKASRNFINLCMLSYYDETTFHRVIPHSIVQGGDPTGTGCGGESVYGAPFKDEFHSRLRFTRRGLVAMANGGPHQNESQFFFTLAAAPHLDKKHTIFGTVAGETVYNMIKLGEGRVNPKTERPEVVHRIKSTEIVLNPFTDIVVDKPVPQPSPVEGSTEKMQGIRNFSLLSFGDDAFEDGDSGEREIFVPKKYEHPISPPTECRVEEVIEEVAETAEPKPMTTVDFLKAEGEKLKSEIREMSAKNSERKKMIVESQEVKPTLADYDGDFAVYSQMKKLPEERKERILIVDKMLDKFKERFRKFDGLVDYSEDEEDAGEIWLHHRLFYDKNDEVIVANPGDQLENGSYAIDDPRNSMNKRRRLEN